MSANKKKPAQLTEAVEKLQFALSDWEDLNEKSIISPPTTTKPGTDKEELFTKLIEQLKQLSTDPPHKA